MSTDQLKNIWQNTFGIEYTKRKGQVHHTEGQLRKTFWKNFVTMVPDVSSVLEIGCNSGMNLEGLHAGNSKLNITGLEPNDFARNEAIRIAKERYQIIPGNVFDLEKDHITADLMITCTVLIHIHPNDLQKALQQIYQSAHKYILTMEYYWPTLKEIDYRGLSEALWKRDFGAYWLNHFDLEIIETGYLGPQDGFDRTTWWLFKKPAHPES
jgi:pseudaminic acid biosynthesis-associated methylase